jgi:hypothetical protein
MHIENQEFKETRSETGQFVIKCLGILVIGVIVITLVLLSFNIL